VVAQIGWRLVAASVTLAACGRIHFDPEGGVAHDTFTHQETAQICVALKSCFPVEFGMQVWGSSLSRCATGPGDIPLPSTMSAAPGIELGFEAALGVFYRCILDAGADCTAAASCLAPAGTAGTCTPAGMLERATCSGSVFEACSADGFTVAVDCNDYGSKCGQYPNVFGFNACVYGGCPSPTRCVGTIAEVCDGGAFGRIDCSLFGMRCNAGAPPGVLPCAGDFCDATEFIDTCDGNTVVSCKDGMLYRTDCTRLPTNRRCQNASCVATGADCDPSMTTDTCAGTDLTFCQDGTLVTVSCVALGYSACASGRCIP